MLVPAAGHHVISLLLVNLSNKKSIQSKYYAVKWVHDYTDTLISNHTEQREDPSETYMNLFNLDFKANITKGHTISQTVSKYSPF